MCIRDRFVTGLVATDVGTELSANAVCDLASEFVATRSEASFPQPEQNPSVVSSKQTAKTLAEVGMVDIQESFRGFLNDSVTLIKMNFFGRIVLIFSKSVKINPKLRFWRCIRWRLNSFRSLRKTLKGPSALSQLSIRVGNLSRFGDSHGFRSFNRGYRQNGSR